MTEFSPHGRPVLLDAAGRPIPTDPDTGRPTGEMYPSGMALPHGLTFIARYQGASHTYWHEQFDEALRQSREDARVMRRDAYISSLMQERTLAVAGLNWHLEVPDERDPEQMRVKDGLTRLVKGIPILRRIIYWLLEALWYGRYGVQIDWDWASVRDRKVDPKKSLPGSPPSPGGPPPAGRPRRALTVGDALPLNGDKIGFQYDHTPYVLVHSGDVERMLPGQEVITTTRGRALSLRGSWRERVIIHRHLMEDEDYFSPEMSGAIHGVGIRSKLFWLNWLKLEWLGNVTSFFDRYGLGVMLWKYPAGNPQAKEQATQAARDQQGRAHILVPVWGEAGREALTGVERMEVPTSGSEAMVKLIQYIDGQLERYVVGQEGSSKANSQGLGNEAASVFMQGTKQAITLHDANLLATTLSGTDRWPGLINTMQRYTYPEADFPVTWHFDVEKPESEKKLQAIRSLVDMNIKVRADDARAAAGVSKPVDGDEVVEPPQQGGPEGGAPGGPGGDPMAALLGGAGGAAPDAQPGQPGPDAQQPAAPEAEAPAGDFLDALRFMRTGVCLRFDWQNKGLVKVSPTGLPLFRYYDPEKRQARIQHVPPGQGDHKKSARRARRNDGQGRRPAASLDLDAADRSRIARALRLMFPSKPAAWVKPSGLPALAGCAPGTSVSADLDRDADGTLTVLIQPERGGAHRLSLDPDGSVTLALASEPPRPKAAAAAWAAAGIDSVTTASGERVSLVESLDALSRRVGAKITVPPAAEEGNRIRREFRRRHARALLARADAIIARPAEPLDFPGPEAPAAPEPPSKHARLHQALARLRQSNPAAARGLALAYARRRQS